MELVSLLIATIIFFMIELIVSTLIIFLITKMFGEKEKITTALLAAVVGAFIFGLAYYFLGHGWLAALIAGFFWWAALGSLYKMTWAKALGVAVIVWIVAFLVGFFLPTVIGPL